MSEPHIWTAEKGRRYADTTNVSVKEAREPYGLSYSVEVYHTGGIPDMTRTEAQQLANALQALLNAEENP